jgi:hypothetical protein
MIKVLLEKGIRGVIAQGYPSVKVINGKCMYRGDNNAKCAIGMLIPDEHYSNYLEGYSVTNREVKTLITELYGPFTARELLYLSSMQNCHDNASNYPADFVDCFKQEVIRLAKLPDQKLPEYCLEFLND